MAPLRTFEPRLITPRGSRSRPGRCHGSYQILVGDSSRNLPQTGTLNLSTPITASAMS